MLGDAVPWKYVEKVVKATKPSPDRLLAIKRCKTGAMASVNPISASCQSIASACHASTTLGGATSCTATAAQYIHGMGSLGRIKYHYQKQKGPDGSDDDFDVSQLSHSTHVLERVKSDHFLASKPDEDRRRRTIIVERKNDSYGFTPQSYGIHYKKEQEVEMITYVDYVEYDGPAYKAGMREGDVILSINGTDMEKADHKTLVDCIKSCDNRMRMVVLFEDCVKKVDLHMRYIQLQNVLQSRMNELERVCLRERELLEGKWKTHSLPARKKVTTSPTDFEGGLSPSDFEPQNAVFCRPTLSTEDVTNITRHQLQQSIIPPPAQYMLTYHYLNPTYRYILKPSLLTSSGEYFVAVGEGGGRAPSAAEQHLISSRTESAFPFTAASGAHLTKQHRKAVGPPPTPPPRTCEKHKPPILQQQQQLQLQQRKQQQFAESKQKAINTASQKGLKSGRHCHGNSCNPCIGHFKWKSAEKTASVAGGDNVSLDAYDLASPCCDTHCVPTRKRNRHHKEHTHKHKHREREREREPKEHAPRPKSATQTSPSTAHYVHHHHHIGSSENAQHQHHHRQYSHQHRTAAQQQQQQPSYESKTGSLRSRYFDLTAGLASHCSLHSCTSSELGAADSTSYTTSLSTDTLHWDPQSENPASRQHSTKSRQSYQQPTQPQQQQQQHLKQAPQQHQHTLQQPHIQGANVYQQRYHLTATQIQPSQIYPNVCTYVNKPKSWDNLATKAIGGYGFGYGYLDTVAMKPPIKLQVAQQRHSMPRKNQNGRYSTYTDVENYAPPPSQFVGELTTTTTTMITTKSAEDLLSTHSKAICDCASMQQPPHLPKTTSSAYLGNQNPKYYYHQNNCHGYYSHLPRPTIDAGTSTSTPNNAPANEVDVATVSEVTRL